MFLFAFPNVTLLGSLCLLSCSQLAAAFDVPPPRASEAPHLRERWYEWLSLATPSRHVSESSAIRTMLLKFPCFWLTGFRSHW